MNDSSDKNICPQCGEEIPPDAPGGLCPRCLYAAAINPVENEPGIPRETNLLFGILGIQLRVFNVNDFIDAAAAWVTDPTVGVPERLRNSGVIDQGQVDFLDGLVKQAIEHHHGDADETLTALNGDMTLSFVLSAATDQEAAEHLKTELGLPPIIEDVQLDEAVSLREEPGRYTRTTPYSRGGMGQIYLVHDEFLNRDVALKELLPFGSDSRTPITPVRQSSNMTARFLREAKLTGQLEHPSIVPVYEMGRREDGSLYYTMKLIRGRTFTEQLKRSEQVDDRLNVLPHFVDLCNAVAYAHSRGVIHRDIKPSNVLIGAFGETVVIDWGLAKVIGQPDPFEKELLETISRVRPIEPQSGSNTQTGEVLGTPSYMSPEQTRGEIDRIDTRSDVFSLGIFLYEILCGQLPFVGADSGEVYDAIREANPIPIQQHEPRIPPELASICMKALAPDSKDRFQNAAELRDELIQFQTGALVGAYDYSSFELLKRYYRQHSTALNTAAAAAAILLVMGVWSFVSITNSRDEAEYRALISELRLANSYITGGNLDEAGEILEAIPEAGRSVEWTFLNRIATPRLYGISGYNGFTFSPDGAYLAVYYKGDDVQIRAAENGELVSAFPLESGQIVRRLAFSSDGQRLVGVLASGTARIWEVPGGGISKTFEHPSGSVVEAAMLPESGNLATVGTDRTLRIWDIQTNTQLGTMDIGRGEIDSIETGHDADRILVVFKENRGEVWDLVSAEHLFDAPGKAFSLSADGATLTYVDEGEARVWDLETGVLRYRTNGHANPIIRAELNSTGTRILTVGADQRFIISNTESNEEIVRTIHREAILSGGFSEDGSRLYMLTSDFSVFTYDALDGTLLRKISDRTLPIMSVKFSPSSRLIMTSSFDRVLRAYNADADPYSRIIAGQDRPVTAISISPDHSRISMSQSAGLHSDVAIASLAVGEMMTGQLKQTLQKSGTYPNSRFAFSPNQDWAAWSPDDFSIVLVDINDGKIAATFHGHDAPVQAIAFHPNGTQCVSASWDGIIQTWAVESGIPIHSLRAHDAPVTVAQYIDDGSKILSGDREGALKLFSTASGEILESIPPHGDAVSILKQNPSSGLIAVGYADGAVAVLDAVSMKFHLEPTKAHAVPVKGLSFWNNQRLWSIASGNSIFWNLERRSMVVNSSEMDAHSGISAVHRLNESQLIRLQNGYLFADSLLPGRSGTGPSIQPAVSIANALRVNDVESTRVLRSAEVTSRVLGVLHDRVENVETRNAAFLVPEEGYGSELRRIGLFPGDKILSINAVPITETAELLAALQMLVGPEALQNVGLHIGLLREERRLDMSYTFLPIRKLVRNETFEREELLQILEQFQDGIRRAKGTISATSTDRERRIGALDSAGKPIAVWLGNRPDNSNWHRYTRLGLSPNDRWVRFNGEGIGTVEDLLQRLGMAIETIRESEFGQVTISLEKGEFTEIELQLTSE